jgi:phospholipid transport system substrate-binding protein
VRERDAKALVTRLVKQMLQAINGDGVDQEERMMALIESETNLSLLARMTLGRHWRRATVEQRKVFVDVFRRYLLQSFTTRLRRYAGTGLGTVHDRFTVLTTKKAGKNDVVVRSIIKPPSGAPLEVDWRLRSRDGRFFIIDLVVEGVSLLITQRSEFGSVVERIGIDGLIGELRMRVARRI